MSLTVVTWYHYGRTEVSDGLLSNMLYFFGIKVEVNVLKPVLWCLCYILEGEKKKKKQ